ncbi:hypothetical protein N7499_006622 [Penicillium canescens]|uniref:Uncharacterized protein n=1 Tax=Penicillium canescens TaxID=5083 RepID=A0AAD6IF12_PENCN|nr:uncharacterized protein N7446_002314 [Penicillium canescens]KAJ5997062.1 hypothetical protein N7522_008722 [Penicillium canescens]KAJ6044118.1 hypothetical protein N7460_005473 [Penicillium canescens]KAJ6055589.1 hypothetical protein N7444_004687 [Penicillium canescens]KAJ6074537.1 hypothetical protein N7446_002314 [Penicillium canescens]KAJ6081748.1 hypothetical protein N7499_006622 [Penicillium canescens]
MVINPARRDLRLGLKFPPTGRSGKEREEEKDKGSKPTMGSPDHTQDIIGGKEQFASQSHQLVAPHQARVFCQMAVQS